MLDVIIDIVAVSSYNCPEGYEPYAFTEWPGINEGCVCETRLNDYDYIHVLPVSIEIEVGKMLRKID